MTTTLESNQRNLLADALSKIRRRIKRARGRSEGLGEQNTKSTLIDPLLTALGWDLEEFDEVRREYRTQPQDNPVDYALFVLRSPRLFIEAKDLSRNLNDRKWISQTLGYATVVGVEWCVLTNGDEYRIYNSHAAVDVEQKLFRRIRIGDSDHEDFTIATLLLLSKGQMSENQLEALWKAHFVDRQVQSAVEELFQGADVSLVRLIRKLTPGLKPAEIRESLKRAELRIQFPVLNAEPVMPPPRAQLKKRRSPKRAAGESKAHYSVRLKEIIEADLVVLPLALERRYKGVTLEAIIDAKGNVIVDGASYESPSTAAGMARKKVIGAPHGRKYPQTNGWSFWQFRDTPSGKLLELDELRKRFIGQAGS